ncbi:hypothetical protein COU58_00275, partial [Candidatus Pacearchaeota archaeon CG10_big_fil_rev_8_21_14_0_10_32_42]
MENKKVGWLILGIATAMGILVGIFNSLMQSIINQNCIMGIECVMHDTANTQLWLGLSIVMVIASIGIYIMFSKSEEKIIIKKIKERQKKKVIETSSLDADEKKTIKMIQEEGNAMFQKDLMEKLQIGKVKMTRL